MSDQWYYNKGDKRHGPATIEQLRQVAASGQLEPTDLVWKKGMAEWTSASGVKGIFPDAEPAEAEAAAAEPATQFDWLPATQAEAAASTPVHRPMATSRLPATMNTKAGRAASGSGTVFSVLKWVCLGIGVAVMALTLSGSNSAVQEAAGAGIACFCGIVARIMQAEEKSANN